MTRSMVKFIHVDNFFDKDSVTTYTSLLNSMRFTKRKYGEEIENLNLIIPGLERVFSKVVGERVKITGDQSGVFRKPYHNMIHFEDFDSVDEWCFLSALEENTLNVWNHISDSSMGEVSKVDSSSLLQGYNFNYNNLFEWKIHTNMVMQPGDGIFIRPWMFHSLSDKLTQYFRLTADNKFRILVVGRSESSRKEIALNISKMLPDTSLIVSKEVREQEKDMDFSFDGKMRHSSRILDYARESSTTNVVIDMLCPFEEMREMISPDILIWVDDLININISSNPHIQFDRPRKYDLRITNLDNVYEIIFDAIRSKINN